VRSAPLAASLSAAGLPTKAPGGQQSDAEAGCAGDSRARGERSGLRLRLRQKWVLVGRKVLQATDKAAKAGGRPERSSLQDSASQEGRKGRQESGPSTQATKSSNEQAGGRDNGSHGAGKTRAILKGWQGQIEGVVRAKRTPVLRLSSGSDPGSSHGNDMLSGSCRKEGPCGREKPRLEVTVHSSPSPFRGQYPFDTALRHEGLPGKDAGGQEDLAATFLEASAGEHCEAAEGPLRLLGKQQRRTASGGEGARRTQDARPAAPATGRCQPAKHQHRRKRIQPLAAGRRCLVGC